MKSIWRAGGVVLAACLFSSFALAQSAPRVTAPIDDNRTVSLEGNVRPEVSAQTDRGKVNDDFAMDGIQILLKRPAAQEAALEKLIDEMQDPASPHFHQWLTAEQIGERYGVASNDIAAVTGWLTSHGFRIDGVSNARTMITFSGTAGEVNTAFHTEVHNLDVKGARHIANVSEPRIPAALGPVIQGVISLNDFRPFPMHELKQSPVVRKGGSRFHTKEGQDVAPGDLAVIYNFKPLFKAGITGKGETIVLIENTYVYNTTDWTAWRANTGINKNGSATITEVHPSGKATCTAPGVNSDDVEAILDTQWASAAAPAANIELAACKNTSTTFGGLFALDNVIDGSKPPQIISVSYGACEASNGATLNAAFNSIYQQGAAEGISIFVASGDQASTVCDRGAKQATHGVGVNGWGSTVYNVSVGGTDFVDTFIGDTSHYWNDQDAKFYESAKSYVPEIPWNDSCANIFIAVFVTENTNEVTYGPNGFCNSAIGASDDQNVIGGSGGPSACATGKPATPSVVSGTCKGYKKPSWQKLVGVPNDGVRDLPDVALFAADGIWAHSYIYCDTDPSDTGAANNGGCGYAGGTSFASPIFAGIQALINQTQKNKAQGNPAPVFYQLAQKEYGASGNKKCNSTGSSIPAAGCIFNDITAGMNNPPCEGKNDCYLDGATIGITSTSKTAYKPAFVSQVGWDFTTGIGTVNAANLVHAWP